MGQVQMISMMEFLDCQGCYQINRDQQNLSRLLQQKSIIAHCSLGVLLSAKQQKCLKGKVHLIKCTPDPPSAFFLIRRWSVVYDMLNGQNNSGFGWDEHRQLVVAEDAVWESYVKSHKEASQFRHRSFPYYNQLTAIYARDRATGKDAQTAADVLEEIHAEDDRTTDMNE
ncbi:hypothetical protein V6Z11_D11G173200 [Gossypium hirsutum]